jgi:4'-phosphopantetheinyl transferase
MRSAPLASGRRVDIWHVPTSAIDGDELARFDSVLSAEERLRRDRFVFYHDRRDFVVAHGLLRWALSRYGTVSPEEWRFTIDHFGKPSLVAGEAGTTPLAFSLAHTRGYVACAIARDVSVGIDVERLGPVSWSSAIAARHFSTEENQLLAMSAPGEADMRFFEIWTLKEAYLKALGAGLNVPLSTVGFSFEALEGLGITGIEDNAVWRFILAAPTPDLRLALAVRTNNSAESWTVTFHGPNGQPCLGVALRRSNRIACGLVEE